MTAHIICYKIVTVKSETPPKKMPKNTIKIAGAGPSGLTAAICLAQAGIPVDIYEAKNAVGARFIGDFQVIENISQSDDALKMLTQVGLATNFFIQPVYNAIFFDHRLRPQPVKSQNPFGYFIRRGSEEETLDVGLLNQALSLGARIHYQSRIRYTEADIVATGPTHPDGLAKQTAFLTSHPDAVWVIFDADISPGGYAYLFIIRGRATLGCAITRNFNRMNEFFNRAVRRFQEISPFTIQSEKRGYSFMSFSLKKSAEITNRPFVGEAGGFQDYLFGLGLRYAFTTGFLAAASITQKTRYDDLWKRSFGIAQEISLVNRYLYERGGNKGLSTFIKWAGKNDLQTYLGRWHARSWWKKLLLPIIKWRWGEGRACAHHFHLHWCRKRTISRLSG